MKLGDLFECNYGRGELAVTKIIDDDTFEVSNYNGSWIQKKQDIDSILFRIKSSRARYICDFNRRNKTILNILHQIPLFDIKI